MTWVWTYTQRHYKIKSAISIFSSFHTIQSECHLRQTPTTQHQCQRETAVTDWSLNEHQTDWWHTGSIYLWLKLKPETLVLEVTQCSYCTTLLAVSTGHDTVGLQSTERTDCQQLSVHQYGVSQRVTTVRPQRVPVTTGHLRCLICYHLHSTISLSVSRTTSCKQAERVTTFKRKLKSELFYLASYCEQSSV